MSIGDSLPDGRQAYGKIKQPPRAAHKKYTYEGRSYSLRVSLVLANIFNLLILLLTKKNQKLM
jgi:hypothetical protein